LLSDVEVGEALATAHANGPEAAVKLLAGDAGVKVVLRNVAHRDMRRVLLVGLDIERRSCSLELLRDAVEGQAVPVEIAVLVRQSAVVQACVDVPAAAEAKELRWFVRWAIAQICKARRESLRGLMQRGMRLRLVHVAPVLLLQGQRSVVLLRLIESSIHRTAERRVASLLLQLLLLLLLLELQLLLLMR